MWPDERVVRFVNESFLPARVHVKDEGQAFQRFSERFRAPWTPTILLLDPDGVEFGRGLVNYPASDVLKVAGRRSTEIPTLLGYKVADEIIHRDNFVLIKEIA